MKMEFLPVPPFEPGPIPPRLRFDPPCPGLVNLLQIQAGLQDEADGLKDIIDEVKRGESQSDVFINHLGAYAEVTPTTVRIYYSLREERQALEMEMALEQFERIADIWREHCADDSFVGVFEV